MDIRTQSALLASIVGLALGLSMLLRPGRPRVFTLYSMAALTVSGYFLAQFLHSVLAPTDAHPWVIRAALGARLVLGALIPTSTLGFFLEFLGASPNAHRRGRQVALLSAVFGVAVGMTPLAGLDWARSALSVWVLLALLISVSLLVRRMRQVESRIERMRLRYLAIGAILTISFAALDFLVRKPVPLPAIGPVVATLYLFFLAQTLLRLRLMDLQELLGKTAAQAVLAVILAAVFATLTAWVKGNPSLFLFNTVVAAFVVIILLEPLRAKVDERVLAIFFRERFELLRNLSGLKQRMVNVIDVTELASLVLGALNETRRVTHASIYLLAEGRPGYRVLHSLGPQPANFVDTAAARGLLNAASSGQKAILLENLDRRVTELRQHGPEGKRTRDEIKRLNDMRQALGQMKAGICVPLVGNDRVIGFFNLWDERVPEAFASDEIALILEIAERFATVVENSKLYEQMRERDRLAALGEMAAGLAHEIRNPLGAIKGAAQCLDPKRLPGEDGEFLEVIVEEVNRLNGVVSAFLDYSRPLKQSFGPTDMNQVVTRTARLIQNDIPAHIQLRLELAENLGKLEGDAEQLKQVLINLVQNAVQALGNDAGEIVLRTARPERFGDLRMLGELVELHVHDSGPGIPVDQQTNIFVPFYTTKQKGTGLGLAICQRIVKNHGGTITVQSRPGEGTTFTLRFPAITDGAPASLPPEPLSTAGTLPGPMDPPPQQVTDPGGTGRKNRKKRRLGAA